MTVYQDASGAPAVLTDGQFTFAADFIGGVPLLRTIGGIDGWVRPMLRRAFKVATATYAKELRTRLGAGYDAWVAASVELYK